MRTSGHDYHSAAGPDGYLRITGIVNNVTGELVEMPGEIHADDADQFVRTWQEIFLLDWEIAKAEAEARA